MGYRLKLGGWGSIFAVPSVVVDKHIKLVGSVQIKVLLWTLRNHEKDFSAGDIAEALSVCSEDVEDAMRYWVETGVFSKENDVLEPGNGDEPKKARVETTDGAASLSAVEPAKPSTPVKSAISMPLKLDNEYVSKRVVDSKEVAFLLQEAQEILGRPTSNADNAAFLALHDNDGLPIDVIIMLIQYAAGVGKGNVRYIETVGRSWAREEIDTLEKAEKKITSLSRTSRLWKTFERIIGIDHRSPTAREEEAIVRWFDSWGYGEELVREAYEICVNANGKYALKYMDGIISRWRKAGLSSLEAVREDVKKSKSKRTTEKRKPSYDLEQYKNYDIYEEIG